MREGTAEHPGEARVWVRRGTRAPRDHQSSGRGEEAKPLRALCPPTSSLTPPPITLLTLLSHLQVTLLLVSIQA